jgi:hypothetical protein
LQAFVPLFVIVVLQDVHLKMAVVLSTALCICLAVGNYWFHRMQVVKVSSTERQLLLAGLAGHNSTMLCVGRRAFRHCPASVFCYVCSESLSEAAAAAQCRV